MMHRSVCDCCGVIDDVKPITGECACLVCTDCAYESTLFGECVACGRSLLDDDEDGEGACTS
jgi:hypothetical protein